MKDKTLSTHRLVFRVHALRRMFQRGISEEDVRAVLATGKTIETYLNDQPYPSRLVLGWRGGRPLHVVIADDWQGQQTVVVTVYEPDSTRWEPGFEQRRRQT